MSLLRHIVILALGLCLSLPAAAQRKTTPVKSDDKKPAQPTLHYYDKHGEPLEEPVLFLATLDTAQNLGAKAKPIYPLLNAVDISVNFWDGIAAIAGQSYGGADVSASLSLWNWLFPTIQIGLGGANSAPEGLNYRYKAPPRPYFKLGADYNFLYKSNPRYRLVAGFRFGLAPLSYSLQDVSITSSYWDQTDRFDITGQRATAVYGELLLGIQVNIWRQWSLGWSLRFHYLLSLPDASASRPWYIPGYGTRGSTLAPTLSLTYTIPLAKPAMKGENGAK